MSQTMSEVDQIVDREMFGEMCGCENCVKIASQPFKCEEREEGEGDNSYTVGCGYEGIPLVIRCQCYEDWAMYCRGIVDGVRRAGPGCPHGGVACPVCELTETIGPTDLLKAIAKAHMSHFLDPIASQKPSSDAQEGK